jgi:hypothetical protein
MRVFPLMLKRSRPRNARVAMLVVIAALTSNCATTGATPVASYDWQFAKLRDDATEQDKAFRTCDDTAKRQARLVTSSLAQIYRYGALVQSCMRFEGWRLTKDPITIRYV